MTARNDKFQNMYATFVNVICVIANFQ